MAKIIFQSNDLKVNNETFKRGTISTGFISDKDILRKRSKKYIEIISGLDAKNLTDTKGMSDLMKSIEEEFGTADLVSLPLGILSKCFYPHPYEVHTLDLSGSQIIRHYKIGEPLPDDFEKARAIAKHNAYAFVEIYKDKIILIREDGTAIKL